MVSDLFVPVIGFFAGVVCFLKGFSSIKRKRLIENTPTSKIRSLAMGFVELYGKIEPKEKLIKSPFSLKDCVYCKYTIEEYRRSGKSSQWVTVKSAENKTFFYLRDDTGKVLVNPEGATMEIPMDFEFNSGWGKDPPESVKRFLQKNGMDFENFLGFNKTMRYREYIIEPENSLFILGTVAMNPVQGVDRIIIQKGAYEKMFYISDRSEKEVLKSMASNAEIGLVLGGILIVLFLSMLLRQLFM